MSYQSLRHIMILITNEQLSNLPAPQIDGRKHNRNAHLEATLHNKHAHKLRANTIKTPNSLGTTPQKHARQIEVRSFNRFGAISI